MKEIKLNVSFKNKGNFAKGINKIIHNGFQCCLDLNKYESSLTLNLNYPYNSKYKEAVELLKKDCSYMKITYKEVVLKSQILKDLKGGKKD